MIDEKTLGGEPIGLTSDTWIPFNKVTLTGRELEYVQQSIANLHISGDGPFTARCTQLLEELTGARRAFLTTSCTDALEMAALLLDLQPGDEVIVPSFTFSSTANAFALRGARIVFADVRPDTLNMDESLLTGLITDRTRAIAPVHYAGVACDMDVILQLADQHGIAIVEDNAHGFLGSYKGRRLGTLGCMATQSFHETKNVSCGEGGALLINDERYVERAEIVREKGTNRTRFYRGEVDKYTWVDVGSSYLPSDMLAAFLCAQLESVDVIQQARKRQWERYYAGLSSWATDRDVKLPGVPPGCEHPSHLFYLLMPSAAHRDAMIAHLKAKQVHSVFHYLPLHTSEFARRAGWQPRNCPVALDISERLLRLPLYYGLSDEDHARVLQSVQAFDFATV